MTEIITGLEDEDIKTEWRRERASDVAADDDATDPGGADATDGTDGDAHRRPRGRRRRRHGRRRRRNRLDQVPDGRRPSPDPGPIPAGVPDRRDREARADALARCVGDPDRFLAEAYRPVAPTCTGAARPFDDVLSLAQVDEALTGQGLRYPAVRVVRDGEVVDRECFTRSARTGRAQVDDLVEPGRVLDLFADGATIVLQALQRWWPR